MNRAKKNLIRNILTMPDDFSEESILLQLVLKEPSPEYRVATSTLYSKKAQGTVQT